MEIRKNIRIFANEIKNDGFLKICLTFKNKEKKIMEKKNFEFKAYNSKGKEIELQIKVVYGITTKEADMVKLGLSMGLCQKYKDVRVSYNGI